MKNDTVVNEQGMTEGVVMEKSRVHSTARRLANYHVYLGACGNPAVGARVNNPALKSDKRTSFVSNRTPESHCRGPYVMTKHEQALNWAVNASLSISMVLLGDPKSKWTQCINTPAWKRTSNLAFTLAAMFFCFCFVCWSLGKLVMSSMMATWTAMVGRRKKTSCIVHTWI